MPQQQGLYDDFTGEKFLWYMAALKGLKRREAQSTIKQSLEVVNLWQDRFKKLRSYSGGMKQRILIVQALLNDPKILIMDEPTAGLDPKERIRIRNFISEISRDKIVLLATHVVSDVEYISKEILVMDGGRIVRHGAPKELLADMEGHVFEVLATPKEQKFYEGFGYKFSNVILAPDGARLRIVSNVPPQVGKVQAVQATLEDAYLHLVK